VWIRSYTASEYASILCRGLHFRSIHDSKEDADNWNGSGPISEDFAVTEYVRVPQPDSSSISTEQTFEADMLLGRCLPLLDTLAHYGNKEAKEVRAEIAKYVIGLKGQSNGRP
jgi:hypothetical protein